MNGENNIMVVGCGMIGSSFAALFAANGYRVYVCEQSDAAFPACKNRIRSIYEQVKQHGYMNDAQIEASIGRCTIVHYASEADACVTAAFECVGEDLAQKHDVYRMLLEAFPDIKAIASSTSAFMPDILAEGAGAPEKVLIAHPVNPPHLVRLVEVVPHDGTAPAAAAVIERILLHCGRVPITMDKAAPGFIINRLQHALLREAFYMVEQGYASSRQIDEALKHSFMPRYTSVGLFEHQDAAGLDLVINIENYLFQHLCSSRTPLETLKKRVSDGELGMKTNKGTYEWDDESKQRFFDGAAEPYWAGFNWPNLKD